MTYLLLCEVSFIKNHLRALHQKQKEMTDDMARALEQSGDGWHDNAAFQAAQESARNIAIQIDDYTKLLRESVTVADHHRTPIGKKFVVAVNDEEKVYLITGTALDVSVYEELLDDNSVPLSHKSPLGIHIVGLASNTPTEFRGKVFTLKEIK